MRCSGRTASAGTLTMPVTLSIWSARAASRASAIAAPALPAPTTRMRVAPRSRPAKPRRSARTWPGQVAGPDGIDGRVPDGQGVGRERRGHDHLRDSHRSAQPVLDPELVAHPADDEVDHVVHRLRPRVERRHRRQHDRPGLGHRRQVPQLDQPQRRLPRDQDQLAPLLQMHVGRPVDQVLRHPVGDGRDGAHAARADGHAGRSGTTRWRSRPRSRGSGGSAAATGRRRGSSNGGRVEVERGRS